MSVAVYGFIIIQKFNINAVGVSANHINYSGQFNRELREILARDKDFFKVIFKPKPTYLGEEISLDESGDITNDRGDTGGRYNEEVSNIMYQIFSVM